MRPGRSPRRPRRRRSAGGDLTAQPAGIAGAGRVGQDAGADPPDRLPGRHRERRAPPRPRPHLHPQGGRRARDRLRRLGLRGGRHRRHLPRRRLGPAAARCGPTAGARPRACSTARARLLGRRPAGADRGAVGRRAWPPRSSGPRPGWSVPTATPRRAAAARRRTPTARRPRRRGLRPPTRSASSSSGLVDFDDLLALCADALEERRVVRRRPALALPPPLRRRVPGREPAAVPPARGLAGRPLRPLRRRRSRSRRSTAGTAPTPAFLRHSSGSTRRPRWSCSTRNYRSTPQILGGRGRAAPGPPGVGAPPVATQADGPPPTVTALRHRPSPRPAASPGRCATGARPGRRGPTQAVLVRTHAQIALIAEALRAAGIPHRSGAAGRCSSGPRCGPPSTCCGATTGRCRHCLADLEPWPIEAAEAQAAGPLARPDDGSRRRAARRGRRGRDARRHLAALVAVGRDYLRLDRLATGSGFCAWLAATVQSEGVRPGAATPSTSPRSTPPRASSGRSCTWPGSRTASCRSPTPAPTAAAGEEARLLYVAMTRASTELHCTWAEQRTFKGTPGRAHRVAVAARPVRAPGGRRARRPRRARRSRLAGSGWPSASRRPVAGHAGSSAATSRCCPRRPRRPRRPRITSCRTSTGPSAAPSAPRGVGVLAIGRRLLRLAVGERDPRPCSPTRRRAARPRRPALRRAGGRSSAPRCWATRSTATRAPRRYRFGGDSRRGPGVSTRRSPGWSAVTRPDGAIRVPRRPTTTRPLPVPGHVPLEVGRRAAARGAGRLKVEALLVGRGGVRSVGLEEHLAGAAS